jgi:Putative Ig domain
LALTGGTASGTLTYSASGLPSELSINNATGLISGTPTSVGDALVSVTAIEAMYSASQFFEWDVLEAGVINPGDQTKQKRQTAAGRRALQRQQEWSRP